VARTQVNNAAIHNTAKQGMPSGKVLYQALENLFYLQHEVKHLFVNKPTFAKYTVKEYQSQRLSIREDKSKSIR